MTKLAFLSGLLSILPSGGQPSAQDTVFDVQKILSRPLHARVLKHSEDKGIVTEEVMFHSETDGAKKIDIFAYFSYPKNGKRLPGLIWNQGGLSKATTFWTVFGAKRGYATLCIDFPLPGYRSTGAYPITSGLALGDDPRQAPIYHGAVALLRAVSYLQSRQEVDSTRIGMAGSSWGGFYTTLMAGLDPRLKAASSMFGCGGLHLGNSWWDGNGWDSKRESSFRKRWQATLDPAWRLKKSKTPIAWFTGTNDQFYWLPALMDTFENARGPKHLSLLPNWNHALSPTLDEQVFAWLDVQLKGAVAFQKVTPLVIDHTKNMTVASWQFHGPRKVEYADLMLSYGKTGNWRSRYWLILPAKIEGEKCIVKLPDGDIPFYICGSVNDKDGFRYSTPIRYVDPIASGFKKKSKMLTYDGCSLWGGFEKEQIMTCLRHGWPAATITNGAKQGKQCALLKNGQWRSPPVLATVGVAHQLTCHVRADIPTTIQIALDGYFDGKRIIKKQKINVTTQWREFKLEYSPPEALTMTLHIAVSIAKSAAVQLDNVRFCPVD